MTTRREQIIAAVATALVGTTGVSTRIYRSRQEAFTRDESPAILIEPVQDQLSPPFLIPVFDWELLVRVSVVARGAIPDQVADATVQSLHSKLMGNAALEALITEIFPAGVQFIFGEAESGAVTVSCDYRIRYRTSQSDLSSLS